MNITTITAVAVKGRNFRHTLSPLTVIVGANAVGKTAITDAIKIALLGYLPALGKLPSKTIELCPTTINQMEVQVEYSDSSRTRRTFTRTRTGASAETSGDAPEIIPAQLDFAEFINAKPTDRHAILATLMGRIDYTALADDTKAQMAALGLLDLVRVTFDPNADAPMDRAIADLADQGKSLKQQVDQNRKTIATFDCQEMPVAPSASTIANLESELAEANEAVGSANQLLDSLNRRLQRAPDEPTEPHPTEIQMAEAEAAIVAAKATLARTVEAVDQAKDKVAELKALGERKQVLERKAALARGSAPKRRPEEIDYAAMDVQQTINETQQALLEATSENAIAETKAKQMAQRIEELKVGICPCCGCTGETLHGITGAMQSQITALNAAATAAMERRSDLLDRLTEAKRTMEDLVAERDQVAAWQALDELNEVTKKIEGIVAQVYNTGDVQQATRALKQAEQQWRQLVDTKAEWQTYKSAEIPTPEAMAQALANQKTATENRNAKADALRTLRESAAQLAAWQAQQNQTAALREECEKLENAIKGIATLRGFLQTAQRDAVEQTMKPLLDTAGIFLTGLIHGTLAKREHRIGIERNGHFIPLEVLSGMEMLVLAAACQAALASRSQLPILIVDEMARMTTHKRTLFMQNCQTAIEQGVIEQAILIDQTPPEDGSIHTILV